MDRTATITTIPIEYVIKQPFDVERALLDIMETRYRALLMEVRGLEEHLINGGRISKSQLRPVRER